MTTTTQDDDPHHLLDFEAKIDAAKGCYCVVAPSSEQYLID